MKDINSLVESMLYNEESETEYVVSKGDKYLHLAADVATWVGDKESATKFDHDTATSAAEDNGGTVEGCS